MTEQATPPAEPTSAEVVEEVESPKAESKTTVTAELLDSDAFVNKVADAVFDRMKGFTGSLLQAQEAAAEIAAEMVPVDNTPAPPPEANEPPPPDATPQRARSHRLFGQPLKRG